MAKKYDDFDDGDQNGFFDQILNIVSERKREFALVSVSAAVLLLGLVVWGSYPDSADTGAAESVPIVRADAGDYKTTPENPGGMEVPYRDSTVFSNAGDNGTENILAEDTTEEPVPRSQLFAGLNTEGDQPGGAPTAETAADAPKGEVEETQAMNKVEPVLPPSNDELVKEAIGVPAQTTATAEAKPEAKPAAEEQKVAAATSPEAVKPAPVAEEPAPEAKAAAKIESAAGASTAAKAVQPGGYYIQLASVRSKDGAAGEFKKLQAKYSSLSGLKYRTQEANLGAKGTFHRIQAGPMSKESATDICTKIKKVTPGACLVTK